MKNTLLEKLVKYKVLFFSLGLIMTFTYIIRNDYVAADAYAEPSDDYVFITDDDPAEVKISVCGRKVNSLQSAESGNFVRGSDKNRSVRWGSQCGRDRAVS